MGKKCITIAGNMVVDYVKIIDTYAQKGMLCNIKSISKSVGGCVPNTLCNIAILAPDIPLKSIGVVGNDEDGHYIREVLSSYQIDVSDVKMLDDEVTSFTDVMTEEITGERTFFQARGANKKLDENLIPYETLPEGIFHIGYALLLDSLDEKDAEYGTVMAKVLKQVQEKGIVTSMDMVSEESERFEEIVIPSLKYLNYFIVNEIEAGKTAGLSLRAGKNILNKENMEEACRQILSFGVRDWVVVHAPEGACAMNKDKRFFYSPSLKLPKGYIQGSVGAGDAFCAAILKCLYKETPMETALKLANAAAACNLSRVDSISGMRSAAEALELCDEFGFRDF